MNEITYKNQKYDCEGVMVKGHPRVYCRRMKGKKKLTRAQFQKLINAAKVKTLSAKGSKQSYFVPVMNWGYQVDYYTQGLKTKTNFMVYLGESEIKPTKATYVTEDPDEVGVYWARFGKEKDAQDYLYQELSKG